MKKVLYEYLQTQSISLSLGTIILSFMAALVLGMVIYTSYRYSHNSTVYSVRFNVSLIMLTLITTMVMTVIGNNVALSLGMVGALSIVRFRTAIKDPRDTTYIFWCVAAGICCGIQDFVVAGIGSGVIFVVMLVLGNSRNNDRYLLIVRGEDIAEANVDTIIRDYFKQKVKLRVDNSAKGNFEKIYEVSQRTLETIRKNSQKDIKEILFEVTGVKNVNLVCQNDEINR